MTPERADLCRRLREARLRAGYTQKQVAERAGIGTSMVSMIESGTRTVNDEHLRFFARLYGVTVGWLFGETEQ